MMQGSLAERLRVLRAQRGLTLVEAAEKTGVGRDTLSDLERGRRHPVMPTLAKIARGYGVPVEELLEEPLPLGDALLAGDIPDSLEALLKQRGARTRYLADKNLLDTLERLPEEDVLQVAREVREEREALAEDRARLNEELQRNPRNRKAFRLLSELVSGSLDARFAIAARMGQKFERVEPGPPEAEGDHLEAAEGAEQDLREDLRDAAVLMGVGKALDV
jgi:transcriptional regulator with XRE-family HTH domain